MISLATPVTEASTEHRSLLSRIGSAARAAWVYGVLAPLGMMVLLAFYILLAVVSLKRAFKGEPLPYEEEVGK